MELHGIVWAGCYLDDYHDSRTARMRQEDVRDEGHVRICRYKLKAQNYVARLLLRRELACCGFIEILYTGAKKMGQKF